MSSNTCVIVSAMPMFMYDGVTVIVSREILTNKTPAQAFTPPAGKKIGAKWAFMYNCSGREHEKWLFKNI